jgi:hypothetical protein
MLNRSFAVIVAQIVFAAFALSEFSAAAQAATFITYVASNGKDTNPCNVVTAPCRTLQRAVSTTLTNGTVTVLTPLQSSATLTKSITIAGDGIAIVGTIVIANASAIVTLRGLALDGVKGVANGIRIDSAAAVHIENCTVEHYTNDGIQLVATTATKLFVSNTVASANGSDGLYADAVNALAEIENSHFDGNASTGLYLKVAKATVLESVASGNVQNGIILRGPNAKVADTTANDNGAAGLYSDTTTAKMTIENSRFDGNTGTGLSLQVSEASVTRSSASGNGAHGVYIDGVATFMETTAANNTSYGFYVFRADNTLDDSVARGNLVGLYVAASGTAIVTDSTFTSNYSNVYNLGNVFSRQNNTNTRSRGGGIFTGNAVIPSPGF